MRQEHDLAGAGELEQPRIDRRLMLEHVEPGAGDGAALDQARERGLVDDLAARRVHDDRLRLHQLEAAAPRAGGRSPACAGVLTETMSMRASIWSRLSQ